eukprot:6459727-Karenia_brevis.AAC.1
MVQVEVMVVSGSLRLAVVVVKVVGVEGLLLLLAGGAEVLLVDRQVEVGAVVRVDVLVVVALDVEIGVLVVALL